MRLLVILMVLTFSVSSFAKTWEIIEKDFVQTAKDYSETEEFKEMVEREAKKKVEEIENMEGVKLTAAEKDEEYTVSYKYTLPVDIPKVNRAGKVIGILYPKGYTFNPLLYITQVPPPIIIFNPCDEEEKAFVNDYTKDKQQPQYLLAAAGGCPLKKLSGYKEPIHLADPEMVKKFNLKYTVSVVSVDKVRGVFNVRVFKTKKADKDKR